MADRSLPTNSKSVKTSVPRLWGKPPAERFWLYTAVTANPDKCWLWTRGRSNLGYGKFYAQRKTWKAHRYAYLLTHGTVPPLLRHKCDNPPCVNPKHLEPGTHADNVHDMIERGRGNWPGRPRKPESEKAKRKRKYYPRKYVPKQRIVRPERHLAGAKLNADQVREMRRLSAEGMRDKDLVKMFGVSKGQVHGIRTRRFWKFIE